MFVRTRLVLVEWLVGGWCVGKNRGGYKPRSKQFSSRPRKHTPRSDGSILGSFSAQFGWTQRTRSFTMLAWVARYFHWTQFTLIHPLIKVRKKVNKGSRRGVSLTQIMQLLPLKRCCCWQQLELLACLFSFSRERELVANFLLAIVCFFVLPCGKVKTVWNLRSRRKGYLRVRLQQSMSASVNLTFPSLFCRLPLQN